MVLELGVRAGGRGQGWGLDGQAGLGSLLTQLLGPMSACGARGAPGGSLGATVKSSGPPGRLLTC